MSSKPEKPAVKDLLPRLRRKRLDIERKIAENDKDIEAIERVLKMVGSE